MTTVVVKPVNVAGFPDGGGHFWVFLQYAQALRELGCDVYWLERFETVGSQAADRRAVKIFLNRLDRHGLTGRAVLYRWDPSDGEEPSFLGNGDAEFNRLAATADLLLNFDYSIESRVLDAFSHSALVDIDPGLLQFWMQTGQLHIPRHDAYLTVGERVETTTLPGEPPIEWQNTRRPVCLDLWPFVFDPGAEALTTVSGWWGGHGEGEWVSDGSDVVFENNKRVSFLEYVELPQRTSQILELALSLGSGDETLPERPRARRGDEMRAPKAVTDYVDDATDRRLLEEWGWRVKPASLVAAGPDAFRSYVQQSRGEFSCAKPSCMYFANAWISDRTLCYLASGKPAIVQDTGPSAILPSADGLFRFDNIDGALRAIDAINGDYRGQADAARDVAASLFDARRVVDDLLRTALTPGTGRT